MKETDVAQFASDKILSQQHIKRVADWANGDNVGPITVEIDMTNKCNSRCPGCAGGRTGNENLPNPVGLIDQLVSLGSEGLIFTGGGEPLADKRTPEMIEYAKQEGLEVALITNGLLINEENAEIIVDNCTWVRVSLDASSADDYLKTHGLPEESFLDACNGIRTLARAKRERDSQCTIGVGYLTRKDLLAGMYNAAAISKLMGADYIQFRPFHGDTTPIDKQLSDCMGLEWGGFRVLWSKHKYDGAKNGVKRDYDKCYGQQFAAVIGADGKMYVCCHMRGKEKYVIGDTNKASIQEIWDSEQRQKVVENIDFSECVPFCRCDTFNRILYQVKKERVHGSFL